MVLELADWRFDVDISATEIHTRNNSLDHCTCGYCKNYYETVSSVYPQLITFLQQFGVNYMGPSEIMPFEPTLILACYRIQGQILQFGVETIFAENIPISVEIADESSFFLWAGEMILPWCQEEPEEEVVSPANLPEFLQRMEEMWVLRHGDQMIQC